MMPRRDYAGKTVVITGGAGGLGAAFARRFHAAGARVALIDLNAEAAAALARELGEALGLGCDVTDPGACQEAMAQVAERFGGVDLLVNNAGITHRSAFADTSSEVFARVMGVNFFGSLYCTQAALPSLVARQGQIAVISSVAGVAPLYGRSGYSAAKHALHGLFGTLRAELKADGVGVTILCPSFTNTGIAHAALDGDGSLTSHQQSTVGRIATPEEVAEELFKAVSAEKRLVVLSTVGKLTYWISKLMPALYESMMLKSLKSELERG
ncbi:MAG: SDR family oxidoreductase [Desulfarculaceae bacterium]|nr:SDR family oxidoreductase [Desulfarculaceae bacterium]MCF8074126.1 SDR family oxidoreductase [Desulfarculaceae bacterium]MCF8103282.1 SDR family oxidoreductase [Desulfarculaceae bacterium]MCF8116860.1 SDR family oxidoreductase [Desulfarculaceae bacterium]